LNRTRLAGISLLLVIVAVGIGVWLFNGKSGALGTDKITVVNGFIGSEKEQFFQDPEIINLLDKKFHLRVNVQKAGSLEMLHADTSKSDFLFPSSDSVLDMFKQQRGKELVKSNTIFTTPIVFDTSKDVLDAWLAKGIATKAGEHYTVDMTKLNDLMFKKVKWSDIGLPQYFGTVSVVATDPNKSNSGSQFAALLANTLNGDVVDAQTVSSVIPVLKSYFARLGFMESSTGLLFESYTRALKNGIGDKPVIAAYESLMIEYAKSYPDEWAAVKDKAHMIYPVPTVWSAQPLIALNDKGVLLMEALQDQEIQRLAWEKHGFRSGVSGVANDPSGLAVLGIPPTIGSIVPMPATSVMDQLLQALQN
jgi:hypothetical protein